jgi:hypothetical protein
MTMPTLALSQKALALFRLHVEPRRTIDVDVNCETYRGLARAGLMDAGNSFAGGEESLYHVTKPGFDRALDLRGPRSPAGASGLGVGGDSGLKARRRRRATPLR